MSGSLTYTPAEVLRQYVVDQSGGTLPSASSAWPVYVSKMPDSIDNSICIYNTDPIKFGRDAFGETQYHYGMLVRVRAAHYEAGRTKVRALFDIFEAAIRATVTISANSYELHSINQQSGPFDLGTEQSTTRELFSMNVSSHIRETV